MNWNSVMLLTDHFHKHAKNVIDDTPVIQVQKWSKSYLGVLSGLTLEMEGC